MFPCKPILILILLILNGLVSFNLHAGTDPFSVELQEVAMPNAPTLQSFAYAQSGGKWLFLSGRTTGLHNLVSAPSFPTEYQNRTMYVYDPVAGQMWSRSTYQDLSLFLADNLSSTNTNYEQVGNKLYIIGGYGLDSTADSLMTFSNLTVIDVAETMDAIINGQSVAPYIRSVTDSRMTSTGGELEYKDGYFYLYAGERYFGEYIGGNNLQYYNYAYSKFQVVDTSSIPAVTNYTVYTDTSNFRRRDLNFVDAIYPDGSPYFINYGAVFTETKLPWLNPIYVNDTGYTVDLSFSQLFNQYDAANLVMFDSTTEDLYTVLFGGLSFYYYDTTIGLVAQDSLIPFVPDITYITKPSSGLTTQGILPVRMPGLLGTEARVIPDMSVPRYDNGVIKFNELTQKTLVGYIFGGIEADAPNMGSSTASDVVLAVYVTPKSVGINNISGEIPGGYELAQNFPNPFNPSTKIKFALPKSSYVKLNIYNMLGQNVFTMLNRVLDAGTYDVTWHADDFASGIYFYTIEADNFVQTKKMVLIK